MIVSGLLAGLSSPGCVFSDLRRDRHALDGFVEIAARVEAPDWAGAPVVVSAGPLRPDHSRGDAVTVSKVRTLAEPGELSFALAPGDYLLWAFEDSDRDNHHDEGERSASLTISVGEAGVVPAELVLAVSATQPELALVAKIEQGPHPYYAIGDVAPLDDERFGPRHGRAGMWEPNGYALERRPGVYMLGPYDPSRTPVLLVHGMHGSPREFGALIDALDETRFQPWVFMYPSGYPLDALADFLDRIIVELERRHDFPRMCVVGYSMGGLVTRGLLARYAGGARSHRVFGYASLASPFGGVRAAARGVKMAPEVVPSWRDLEPGSAFLTQLYAHPLDDQVEYHLLTAVDGKGASDGVVSIASQTRAEAEAEAEVLRAYRASHAGILEHGPAIAQVVAMAERCRAEVGR